MKVLIVGLVAWMCWSSSVMVGASGRIFPVDVQYDEDKLEAIDLTFTIVDVTVKSYTDFLEKLRELGACSTVERYDIPILCDESGITGDRFLKVQLLWREDESATDSSVTLALDKVNLSVVAYSTGYDKSYFFLSTEYLKPLIFQGTNQITHALDNTYTSLGNRLLVELGITSLLSALDILKRNIYADVPPSLITVFGMVPEAARFKLIQNSITAEFDTNIPITPQIISYEDKWMDFSINIQEAVDNNGVFPNPVEVFNESGQPLAITNIGQAEPDIGIIQYFPTPSPPPPPTPSPPPPPPPTPTPPPPKMYAFAC